jgi:hypothetical protein
VGKIIKTGTAALNVHGPLLVSYDSTFEVQQGTLNVNGNVIPATADSTLNITNNGGSTTFNASLSLWAGNRLRVNVDGTTPNLTVGTGRVLSGSGTLVNGASIGLGGTLRPGESTGILTVGDLTLSSGAILLYELGAPEQLAPGQVATGGNDLTAVTGNLTLDGGALYVTDVGGFTNGVYTIFTYTGALVTSNLTVAPLPGGLSGVVDYSVTGEVNLQVIPEPSAGLLVGVGLLVLLAVRRRGTR